MKTGKPSWDLMSRLLSLLPVDDIDIVVGPSQGEDAAIIRLRDGFLVVHSDPITTGVKRAGYLAVHVAGNDVAVRGVKPKWFLPVILFPSSFSEEDMGEFFEDMSRALNEINGVVIGGHTEITPGINRPIVSMTAIGYTNTRVISTRDAKPGDLIYVIGRIAGEGAGVIAWDFAEKLVEKHIEPKIIEKARNYIYQISVVKTALGIRDYVSAMHDATEGGVLQAIREVAVASGTRAIVDISRFVLEEEVREITNAVNVDPLKLLSSGCIIATVSPGKSRELEHVLEDLRIQYSLVGHLETGSGEVVLLRDNRVVEVISMDIVDEIYKLW